RAGKTPRASRPILRGSRQRAKLRGKTVDRMEGGSERGPIYHRKPRRSIDIHGRRASETPTFSGPLRRGGTARKARRLPSEWREDRHHSRSREPLPQVPAGVLLPAL